MPNRLARFPLREVAAALSGVVAVGLAVTWLLSYHAIYSGDFRFRRGVTPPGKNDLVVSYELSIFRGGVQCGWNEGRTELVRAGFSHDNFSLTSASQPYGNLLEMEDVDPDAAFFLQGNYKPTYTALGFWWGYKRLFPDISEDVAGRPGEPFYSVRVPLYAPTAIFAAPPVWWLGTAWRRRRRRAAGRCDECGYDLRGSPAACPECGKRLPDGSTAAA